MIFIVFLKNFEFWKAIGALKNIIVHTRIRNVTHEFDVVCYNKGTAEDPKYRIFLCKVIDDSDIKFLLKLNDFMRAFKEHYRHHNFHEFRFAVFGTCGTIKETNIGAAFYINVAHKGDRGHLRNLPALSAPADAPAQEKHYLWVSDSRAKKKLCARVPAPRDTPLTDHGWRAMLTAEGAAICSMNSLMESSQPIIPGVHLYDMETYDFFEIVLSHGATLLGAIRVVSDKCGKDEKINRRCCSFQAGIQKLDSFIDAEPRIVASTVDTKIRLEYLDLLQYANDPTKVTSLPALFARENPEQPKDRSSLLEGKPVAQASSQSAFGELKAIILAEIKAIAEDRMARNITDSLSIKMSESDPLLLNDEAIKKQLLSIGCEIVRPES
ncbi:uncharacterized protein EV422DRAFT_566701 [Fimicolochytrium jonesii]|uniref:uncharacterized protein n=1 Tax=Fimicolochytrium jonesii TaxID=1396493 RepID=UPI0022FE535C|nr:uncharacterized protein EV422DRAFT_566701 [Fimicolochytrium jonesii]KAI8821612.1 hypothetical protein EV422DRAFT_566701 [Fimicolochytrium jonesii]